MAEQLVNVHDLVGRCPFATSQKLLAGKWSLLIMHELSEGPVRFRELERRLYPITQATLRVIGQKVCVTNPNKLENL